MAIEDRCPTTNGLAQCTLYRGHITHHKALLSKGNLRWTDDGREWWEQPSIYDHIGSSSDPADDTSHGQP